MLLNKHNLSIVAVASEDEGRPALQGLHVTNKYTEACNGHILVRLSLPKHVTDKDFPKVKGFAVKKTAKADFILPTDAVIRLAKSLPKKTILPIRTHVQIDPAIEGGTTKHIRAAITDDDVEQIRRISLVPESYPKTDKLFFPDESAFRIKLNPALLAKALTIAAEFQDKLIPEIVLEIPQPEDGGKWRRGAITIKATNDQGQELIGLVMPLRPPEDE